MTTQSNTQTAKMPRTGESGVIDNEPNSSSRVIRDNFSMPESDHGLIGTIQDRLLKEHALAKNKSEILRAGLHALSNMDPDELLIAIQAVEQLKPGRKPSR